MTCSIFHAVAGLALMATLGTSAATSEGPFKATVRVTDQVLNTVRHTKAVESVIRTPM